MSGRGDSNGDLKDRAGSIRLAFRLALRELRGGLSGFYIFLGCVIIGTAAIAGVNSVSRMMTDQIAGEGRTILGGDIRFSIPNRAFTETEMAWFDGLGQGSGAISLRTMVRTPHKGDPALVELRAVDEAYPLVGRLKLEPPMPTSVAFAKNGDSYGVAVAQILLDRLGLKIGDRLLIGTTGFEIRAVIVTEPDALSEGFAFAPRVMVSRKAMSSAGIIRPGSIYANSYRVLVDAGKLAGMGPETLKTKTENALPDSGLSIRTSERAAPRLTRNIEQFSAFLTLVGLTALIVGGVGVANAVRAFIDGKRTVIATLKCIGAPSQLVVLIYLIQVMLIAGGGILGGLALGAAMPFVAAEALSGIFPITGDVGFYPVALLQAGLFGMMVAFAFALAPLGRAGEVPATALFRQQGFEAAGLARWPYLAGSALSLAILCVLAILFAKNRDMAAIFMAGVAGAFLLLAGVGRLVQAIARRAPTVRSTPLRLAIGNIHRPGALTSSVVLSLGLGLALLVTLAQIDANLRRELSGSLPVRAPDFFFIDIQSSEIEDFERIVRSLAPGATIEKVPMLRGRITALDGEEVNAENVPPGGRWVLRGDRGVTYSAQKPENATLTAGEWWPSDYSGEPLVSFSSEEAKELGLGIGDMLSVSVLGRTITARIANLRQVEWESLSINFVMVFTPNTFAGAPHTWLATLDDPKADPASEANILRTLTATHPTITSVRVKDAIDTIGRLVGQIAAAIRAAASIALISSVLVLAGALAAGNRGRSHDAVVLKTLGASRAALIRAYSYEYALIGLATALFALAFGALASWFVTARIMDLPSDFSPLLGVVTLTVALAVTIGIGLIGTWRILGQKAAPYLREL